MFSKTPNLLIAVITLMMTSAGCQTMWRSHAARTAQEKELDREDQWKRDAGDIARTEHTYEPVNDPLKLRKYFTSDKARQIERNVGIGD